MTNLEAAATILESGGLVAFPTETVYGLGADAQNPAAVAAIYTAKGRPTSHPLIVHLATGADPDYWSSDFGASARTLMAAFWPGPLTLIVPRALHISDVLTGGQNSIGLRCPAHPVAQALLHAFKAGKGGIAAPSANRFGRVSPTTADHVREEFCDVPLVRCVLEGGQSTIGIESTIVDLTRDWPVLLRPGAVSGLQIAEVLGAMPTSPTSQTTSDSQAPRVSGSMASHYAPRTPLALVTGAQLPGMLALLRNAGRRVALMHHRDIEASRAPSVVGSRMPSEPIAYAHDLYATLRRLDHADAEVILVEALPETDAWQAVSDRITRAAHGSGDILRRLI